VNAAPTVTGAPVGAPTGYANPGAVGAVPKTNGMAIASLVTSLVCFGFLGIIFGFIATSQIKASNGQQTGQGMATAGIIIGLVTTVFGLIFYTIQIVG
jgi:VIT1/CCC1 family predicted Fe2+/Mn2+ transporter